MSPFSKALEGTGARLPALPEKQRSRRSASEPGLPRPVPAQAHARRPPRSGQGAPPLPGRPRPPQKRGRIRKRTGLEARQQGAPPSPAETKAAALAERSPGPGAGAPPALQAEASAVAGAAFPVLLGPSKGEPGTLLKWFPFSAYGRVCPRALPPTSSRTWGPAPGSPGRSRACTFRCALQERSPEPRPGRPEPQARPSRGTPPRPPGKLAAGPGRQAFRLRQECAGSAQGGLFCL